MCQHDIGKQDCTVLVCKRRCMVAPSTVYGVCTKCGESFTYIKNEDGVYVLKEEADENIGSNA